MHPRVASRFEGDLIGGPVGRGSVGAGGARRRPSRRRARWRPPRHRARSVPPHPRLRRSPATGRDRRSRRARVGTDGPRPTRRAAPSMPSHRRSTRRAARAGTIRPAPSAPRRACQDAWPRGHDGRPGHDPPGRSAADRHAGGWPGCAEQAIADRRAERAGRRPRPYRTRGGPRDRPGAGALAPRSTAGSTGTLVARPLPVRASGGHEQRAGHRVGLARSSRTSSTTPPSTTSCRTSSARSRSARCRPTGCWWRVPPRPAGSTCSCTRSRRTRAGATSTFRAATAAASGRQPAAGPRPSLPRVCLRCERVPCRDPARLRRTAAPRDAGAHPRRHPADPRPSLAGHLESCRRRSTR